MDDSEERAERAAAAAEVTARLRSRGITVTGGENPEDLVDLLSAVERFEAAVEAHGGDLMVDDLKSSRPDDSHFVMPRRVPREAVQAYITRIDAARAASSRGRSPTSPTGWNATAGCGRGTTGASTPCSPSCKPRRTEERTDEPRASHRTRRARHRDDARLRRAPYPGVRRPYQARAGPPLALGTAWLVHARVRDRPAGGRHLSLRVATRYQGNRNGDGWRVSRNRCARAYRLDRAVR